MISRPAWPRLAGYHYLPAARGEFLRRLHRTDDARLAYTEALILAENQVERDFLEHQLSQLPAVDPARPRAMNR